MIVNYSVLLISKIFAGCSDFLNQLPGSKVSKASLLGRIVLEALFDDTLGGSMAEEEDSQKDSTPSERRGGWRFVLSSNLVRAVIGVLTAALVAVLATETGGRLEKTYEVGDLAVYDIRASRTLEITDEAASEARKLESVRGVRPVFDLDSNVLERLQGRIAEAFRLGRETLIVRSLTASPDAPKEDGKERRKTTPSPADGERSSVEATSGLSPTPEMPPENVPSVEPGLSLEKLRARMAEAPLDDLAMDQSAEDDVRYDFQKALGIQLPEVFYESIARSRFSEQLESRLRQVLSETYQSPVVADRSNLPVDLSVGGITVIRSGADAPEQSLTDGGKVLELKEAVEMAHHVVDRLMPDEPQEQRDTVVAITSMMLEPNLTYNAAVTNFRRRQAHDNVRPVTFQIKKGTVVVRSGDLINQEKLVLLQGMAKAREAYNPYAMFSAMSVFVMLLLTGAYLYASSYIRKFSTTTRDLFVMGVLLVFGMALTRIGVAISNGLSIFIPRIDYTAYYYAIPVAVGAMLVRILMNSETALVFAVLSSVMATTLVEHDVFYFVYFLLSGLAAAGGISHTRERVHVLRGGVLAGLVNALCTLVIFLVQAYAMDARDSSGLEVLAFNLLFAFLGGVLSAVLTLGFVPLFELLGYVTDYRLLELASLDHPLLKNLMLQAPGTYHHSVIVGSLSEAAARAIGCNALLARVGCYYHDIGKGQKPDYFVENLRDTKENKHNRLEPAFSVRIIIAHVREGIELARRHRIPQPIIDLIPQHHGTSLVSFFYHKARQELAPGQELDENDFRYPGPRPQTREAAIVMLADATEASTRSITQINPAKIKLNLDKIFNRIISDRQLDECPLTLKDLGIISDAFMKVLLGIYHSRIEYPADYKGASVPGQGTGAVLSLGPDPSLGGRTLPFGNTASASTSPAKAEGAAIPSPVPPSLVTTLPGTPSGRKNYWHDHIGTTSTADPVLDPAASPTSARISSRLESSLPAPSENLSPQNESSPEAPAPEETQDKP